MKAILVNDDNSLSWSDVNTPVIKPDEVLVEIYAAALNRADLMQREGDYPPPEGCPEWMGLEIAGVIVQIGDEAQKNSAWKTGDKVCALLGGGGYAEFAAVKYDILMPVPENCSMAEAAAIPEAFATAYLNLFIEGKIKPGNTLLMNAGASGLASVVIPMAKAFGIRVITTVLSDEIADSIKPLNADIIVNTSKENIADVLKVQLADGKGVDVAIDCLGGKIINVASVAGVYGNANMVHYSATKGAVISLTKALAKEVADKGVSVNAVSPGTVSPSDNPDMTFHRESDLSYMGRTGTAEENAALICFLAGDEANYISGQNIQIDGCRKRV